MTGSVAVPLDLASLPAPFAGRWMALGGTDDAWNAALANAPSVPPLYVRSLSRYYAAYVAERSDSYVDLSLLLQSNGVPVAVWPLGAFHDAHGWHLTSSDGPMWPPLICTPLPDKLAKRLVADCLDTLMSLARRLGISELVFTNRMLDGRLDLFHQTLMDRGARLTTTHSLGVDLTLDLEDIRLNFRKSYRPLITKGLGTWEVALVAARNPSVFEEFRLLHRDVAGRTTRGLATWELQHEALSTREAFLVTLRDRANGRLVGAGYFNLSRTDGLYAVAAYDRALFDLPLGHVVQYKAIEHMKSQGLRWYSIGARPYESDDPAPSAKEAQIAQFKQGFATHLLPAFTLRLPVTTTSAAPMVPSDAS